MNAAENHSAAFCGSFQRSRHELAGRCEDDCSVELDWRIFSSIANPRCAQLMGQGLMTLTIARAHVNFCAARARELNANVAGCAKAIDAEPCSTPVVSVQSRQAQTAIADYPGAKQWRGLNVFETARYLVRKRSRRDSVFRISTIDSPTRKERLFTKVFASGNTILTFATRAIEPRYTDSIVKSKICN